MNDQTYFLANAAHELQTLLSLLCSSIQAIEAAHPEVRCYRYWPELSSDCRLMTKLLRDLTDYSMSDQLINSAVICAIYYGGLIYHVFL